MIEAVINLNRLNREELHNQERPVAYLAFQNAEMNRDKNKRRRPFSPEEFYYYQDIAARDLPEPKYGAAARALIEKGMFPSWALFAYKDLSARADDALPPEFLCLQCDDAIILAPSLEGSVVLGMLIAAGTASNQVREMRSPCGKQFMIRLPEVSGKFVAEEEAEARLLR